jgi:hypothetical protein
MFDVGGSLINALRSAGDGLANAASDTARAQTPFGSSRSDAAMAGVAQRAIFAEALMNAVHSRFAEVKNATHG